MSLSRCQSFSFRRGCGLVVAVLAIRPALAEEPLKSRPEDLSAAVARLIVELDADARSVRVQAEKDLRDLGPRVLSLLPAPEELPSAAVRAAVLRVRGILEEQKARESVVASRITLHGTTSLEALAREFAAQTGNVIEIQSLPAELRRREFPVEWQQVSFWEALNSVTAQEKLRIAEGLPGTLRLQQRNLVSEQNPREGTSTQSPRSRDEIAVQPVEVFRVAVRSVAIRPSLVEGAPRLLRVQLGLMLEPRLRPLFLKYAPADFKVTVDGEQLLEPTSPQARFELPVGEGAGDWNVQLDFNAPGEETLKQAHLHGNLSVLTAAAPERFVFERFPDVRRVSQRRGGVTVRVDDVVTKAGDDGRWEAKARIVVNYDTGGPAFESHRTWIFQNQAWIEADGQHIEYDGTPLIRRQEDGSVAMEYDFVRLPPLSDQSNWRFVYEAPTLLIDVPVTFEFPNLSISHPAKERTSP